jgi:hypothetical protein
MDQPHRFFATPAKAGVQGRPTAVSLDFRPPPEGRLLNLKSRPYGRGRGNDERNGVIHTWIKGP